MKISINESELKKIITESIKKILKEEQKQLSIAQQMRNMQIGDAITVDFPDGFIVEYTAHENVDGRFQMVKKTSPLVKVVIKYIDLGFNRKTMEYYLYNGTDNNWFTKGSNITKRSMERLQKYFATH